MLISLGVISWTGQHNTANMQQRTIYWFYD
jgi:hypothetical protein